MQGKQTIFLINELEFQFFQLPENVFKQVVCKKNLKQFCNFYLYFLPSSKSEDISIMHYLHIFSNDFELNIFILLLLLSRQGSLYSVLF